MLHNHILFWFICIVIQSYSNSTQIITSHTSFQLHMYIFFSLFQLILIFNIYVITHFHLSTTTQIIFHLHASYKLQNYIIDQSFPYTHSNEKRSIVHTAHIQPPLSVLCSLHLTKPLTNFKM